MERRSGSSRRILIVDDDEGIRKLMKAIFAPLEIDVEFAADGEVARHLLHQRDYDAVVLDLFLPSVDGFEIIREMKVTRPALLAHTMILTAANERTLREFTDGRLVSCIVRKPFDVNGFVQAVLTCCGVVDEKLKTRGTATPKREYGGDPPGNLPRPSDL